MPNRSPTRRALLGLMAVAVLGLIVLAAWPREPTYKGRRLSLWIDALGRSQDEGETLSDVRLRYQTLTNTVQSLGSKAASTAVAWIRDKPRKSLYDDIQYSIENALRARIRLPSRKDRSGEGRGESETIPGTAQESGSAETGRNRRSDREARPRQGRTETILEGEGADGVHGPQRTRCFV